MQLNHNDLVPCCPACGHANIVLQSNQARTFTEPAPPPIYWWACRVSGCLYVTPKRTKRDKAEGDVLWARLSIVPCAPDLEIVAARAAARQAICMATAIPESLL